MQIQNMDMDGRPTAHKCEVRLLIPIHMNILQTGTSLSLIWSMK